MPPRASPKQIKSDPGDTDEQDQEKPPSAIALEAAAKADPKSQKKLLVTNKSKDDLIHQDLTCLKPVETHKKEHALKSSIKQFKLDFNKLTGLSNFTEISKEPLALPAYAKPEKDEPVRHPQQDQAKER